LVFPTEDESWGYNITRGNWFEWDDNAVGTSHMHPAMCSLEYDGEWLLGTNDSSQEPGAIITLDNDVYTHDSDALTRTAYSPYVEASRERVFFNEFKLWVKENTGTSSISPEVDVSWSDDGASSWSTERALKLGQSDGDDKILSTQRLGSSRNDRIFRIITEHIYENVFLGGYLR